MKPRAFTATEIGTPLPAVGRIPFPGHRSQGEIMRASITAQRRELLKVMRKMEFGFDPASLVARG